MPTNFYNSNGFIATDFASANDQIKKIIYLSNGELLAVGLTTNYVPNTYIKNIYQYAAISKYNSDGSIESTFGNSGLLTFKDQNSADDVLELSSGNLLVVTGKNLICLNPDGSLHTYYGTSGFTQILSGSNAISAAQGSDGSVFLIYSTILASSVLAKYLPNGTQDTSFANNGRGFGISFIEDIRPAKLVVLNDGSTVAIGTTNFGDDFGLIKYSSTGIRDGNFGDGGVAHTNFGGSEGALDAVLQSDGKILVCGYTNGISGQTQIAIARYSANGVLDNTFDSDGKLTTIIGSTGARATNILIQQDGKILVSGYSGFGSSIFVIRYNIDGSLDSTFDSDGVKSFDSTIQYHTPNSDHVSMALQADGKIVLGAYAKINSTDDFLLVRLNSNGSFDNGRVNGTTANDLLYGNFSNDFLDGGAGFDTVTLNYNSKGYSLKTTSGLWQLVDNVNTDGTDTLTNIEKLQFTDRAVIIESQSHDSYADLPTELYQFFITAFNAAPGVTYMDQLAEAYRYGLSVKQIVDIFTTKKQFTDVYSPSLSHSDLATQLVNNIVKNSASASAKTEAISDIKGALDLGWTVGDVIYTVFGNLAHKDLSDPNWGNTAKQFNNEIAVAKFYTEVLNQSTTDLETLRDVIQPVTQSTDVSSDVVIAQLVGVALMTGGAGP